MKETIGYVRADNKNDFADQETMIRIYGLLSDAPVRLVFSDRGEDEAGFKDALAAVGSARGGLLVTAYRSAIGDYRRIDQVRHRLEKDGAGLVIIEDPYREAEDHEAAFCTTVLKALRDYRDKRQ